MKFRDQEARMRKKAREAGSVELNDTQELEFDPKQVVPKEIWDRIDWFLKTDMSYRETTQLPLLCLALLDKELSIRVRQDEDLVSQIQIDIDNRHTRWPDADIAVNADLAKYADLFPDVLNGLDGPLAPIPHDFKKSLESFDEIHLVAEGIASIAPRFRALLQLFPEKTSLILQKMEEKNFWEEGMEGARQLVHQRSDKLPAVLADLAIIFPEHREEILEVVRPWWAELRSRIKSWGRRLDIALDDPDTRRFNDVMSYVDSVLGMAALAQLFQQTGLGSAPPLPKRSLV